MTEQDVEAVEVRALEAFERWLKSLASDAEAVAVCLGSEAPAESAQRLMVGGLNYILRSLDLIDDGIEALGFLDDAIILRLCASKAERLAGSVPGEIASLAEDVPLVREALGELAERMQRLVGDLDRLVVRGRSVEDILGDSSLLAELTAEVTGWAARYEPPAFFKDEKNLVKLHAFLDAKLPK